MSTDAFDTIIVGARCAGASLAAHLARAGQKVLLLDAAKLPSNQPLSTHFVHAYGVGLLDELGVGAAVRELTPPSHVMRLDLDGTPIDVPVPGGRAGHCVRRVHLDRLLQEAAIQAGAELRDQSRVCRLLKDGERVVGVEVKSGSSVTTHRAKIVVGADGRDSMVAKLVSANEYHAYEGSRFMYWSYWPAPPGWREKSGFQGFDAYIGFAGDRRVRFVFQTDSNLLLISVAPDRSELPAWKGQHESRYLEALHACPLTARLVEGNQRVADIVGILRMRYFFRDAVGPGFALVGDAGLHKDPTPGLGITDALRDARSLARAIVDGSELALNRYWRERDLNSIDLFHFAKDMGDPNYVNPLNRLVFSRVQKAPDLIERLAASVDRQFSPYSALPTRTVVGWVLGAMLRGNLSVFPHLVQRAKHEVRVERARRERALLLDAL